MMVVLLFFLELKIVQNTFNEDKLCCEKCGHYVSQRVPGIIAARGHVSWKAFFFEKSSLESEMEMEVEPECQLRSAVPD